MPTAAQIRARNRFKNASRATRRAWAAKAARTRLKTCRAQCSNPYDRDNLPDSVTPEMLERDDREFDPDLEPSERRGRYSPANARQSRRDGDDYWARLKASGLSMEEYAKRGNPVFNRFKIDRTGDTIKITTPRGNTTYAVVYADGSVAYDRPEMVPQAVRSRVRKIAKNPEMEIDEMEMSENPELLVVDNPRRKRRKKASKKRRSSRRGKGGPRRIKYRGKLLYFVQIMRKYGKRAARKAFKVSCRKKKRSGRRLSRACRKALPGGRKGNWMALVKKYGVKRAAKLRRSRRRGRKSRR